MDVLNRLPRWAVIVGLVGLVALFFGLLSMGGVHGVKRASAPSTQAATDSGGGGSASGSSAGPVSGASTSTANQLPDINGDRKVVLTSQQKSQVLGFVSTFATKAVTAGNKHTSYATALSGLVTGGVDSALPEHRSFTGSATVKSSAYMPTSASYAGRPCAKVVMADGATYYAQVDMTGAGMKINSFESQSAFAQTELGSIERVPGSYSNPS